MEKFFRMTKICTKCGEEKIIDKFTIDRRKRKKMVQFMKVVDLFAKLVITNDAIFVKQIL